METLEPIMAQAEMKTAARIQQQQAADRETEAAVHARDQAQPTSEGIPTWAYVAGGAGLLGLILWMSK